MPTVKESAIAYEGKVMSKNIVELPEVSVELDIKVKTGLKTKEGKSFEYKYIVVNSEEYRVPDSVLNSLKMILEDNPNLKKFKVKSIGKGLDTVYTVIPLV